MTTKEITPEQSYKPAVVAEMLDISESTLYRLIRHGDIKAFRFGRNTRIAGSEIIRIQSQH